MKDKINKKTAVFLDRDGTIIVDAHFLDDPDRIELLPGTVEGIKRFNDEEIPVIILTNQSGVARGLITEEIIEQIHNRLIELLEIRGAKIDRIYYCPHHPEGTIEGFRKDCTCRKPKTGMAVKAAEDMNIDLSSSYVVGDKESDMQLARNINAKAILVRTGKGNDTEQDSSENAYDNVFDTLSGAADFIVRRIRNRKE